MIWILQASIAKSDYTAQAQLSELTAKWAQEYAQQQREAFIASEKEKAAKKTRRGPLHERQGRSSIAVLAVGLGRASNENPKSAHVDTCDLSLSLFTIHFSAMGRLAQCRASRLHRVVGRFCRFSVFPRDRLRDRATLGETTFISTLNHVISRFR